MNVTDLDLTGQAALVTGGGGIDEECGRLAVFLASPLASYITGTIIPVDGGNWASSGWIRNDCNEWVLPPEITQ